MDITNTVTTPVTHVTGALTIGSAAASKIAESVASSSTSAVSETANHIIVTSDTLAFWSFIIMLLTFCWNIYIQKRRDRREEQQRKWEREQREREFELKLKELQKKTSTD